MNRYLTAGVIGHVDHGKTALVKALTGVETDRLPEEQSRGISIALGFAALDRPAGRVAFVDAPGHEKFVRTMIAGATGIGAVLLVVDVREGIKPQTVEHLDIARLLGIERGVLVLSKADLADEAGRASALDAVRDIASDSMFADVGPLFVSAETGEGTDALLAALDGLLDRAEPPEDEGCFHLPVDRVFTMRGFGSVVTGTLRRGSLRVGDAVEVYPHRAAGTVRRLESHGAETDTGWAGRRTAVNVRGLEGVDLGRGDALATPGSLATGRILDVALEALPHADAIRHRQHVRLLYGTTETFARVHLLDRDAVAPGEEAMGQLLVESDTAFAPRDRYIVRRYSPMETLGGGTLLGVADARRKRGRPEVVERLRVLAQGDIDAVLRGDAEERAPRPVEIREFAVRRRYRDDSVRAALARGGYVEVAPERYVSPETVLAIRERVTEALTAIHESTPHERGMTAEGLRDAMRADGYADVVQFALDALVSDGVVRFAGGAYGLASRAGEDDAREASLREEIEAAFRAGGLEPPDIREVVGKEDARQAVYRRLIEQGILVKTHVVNKPRTLANTVVFHRDAVETARETLADAFHAEGSFATADAKAALGVSRKYLIPLLEHLDAEGFTRRQGPDRVIVS